LLSNCTTAVSAVSANPLFVPGALTHPCTAAVTSTVTNSPAAGACAVPVAAPSAGSVLYVTLYSPHAPFTACTLTVPGVFARLQYSRSVARVICAAVVPAGSTPRSNCTSAV
jgi:hypothetical protein